MSMDHDPIAWETGRILDANFNRAREGLRVMEEHARFVLGDASLSALCKQLRHDLVAAMGDERLTLMKRCRDVRGDVGTRIAAEGQHQRRHVGDVLSAGSHRVAEALRVIEEHLKLCDPAAAARVEQLRYRGYEAEQRLLNVGHSREQFARVSVYVILTEQLCRRGWFETAVEVLAGGAEAIQLREKGLADRELLDRARRLAALCRQCGAWCIVNDRPDVAALAGAHGVHVGTQDLPVRDARRIVGPRAIVGVSTHNVEHVRSSLEQGPDYVACGPMFATRTKPSESIAGPQFLRTARGETALPRVAIGGIDDDNLGQVLSADPGAVVCVCSSVIGAEDPKSSVEQLRRRVLSARSRTGGRADDQQPATDG